MPRSIPRPSGLAPVSGQNGVHSTTTERPSMRENSNSAALHSVGIGTPQILRRTVEPTRFSQNWSPDAPTLFEKSG